MAFASELELFEPVALLGTERLNDVLPGALHVKTSRLVDYRSSRVSTPTGLVPLSLSITLTALRIVRRGTRFKRA
jgi:hypothetical protein